MVHLKILVNLIYRTVVNNWRTKNNVYFIFTFIISVIFAFQFLSANGMLVYFLRDASEVNLYKYLSWFFHLIFILWFIAPLLFGMKLSFTMDFSQLKYLPIRNYIYVIVNNILGIIGVGPLITLIIVYTILYANFNPDFISSLLITVSIFIFINISGLISFLINRQVFDQRQAKSRFRGIVLWLLLVLYLLFTIYFKDSYFIQYLYKSLPSTLVVSGFKGLIIGNSHLFVLAILGLTFYFILCNYLYLLSLSKANFYQPREKGTKTKYRFQKSYFKLIESLLTKFILNTRIRMLITKEINYYTKNARLTIWNVMQLFAAYLFFGMIIKDIPNPFIGSTVVVTILGLLNLSLYMNIFAFDSGGFQNYFTYPTSLRLIYFSKNVASLLISLILLFGVGIIANATPELSFTWLQWLTLVCLYLYSNIISQSLGNIFSIYFVKNIPYDQIMGEFNSFISMIITMFIMIIMPIPSIIMAWLNTTDIFRFGVAFLFLFLSLLVYRVCLTYASKKLLDKRMIILNELI